jgi:hypothetical protein
MLNAPINDLLCGVGHFYTYRMARELKALFCEQFGCSASEFDHQAFKRCLYPHARFAVPLLLRMAPALFEEDFKFIQMLGTSTSMREAKAELQDFHEANRGTDNFIRTTFKLRVSGRKATDLAGRLFAHGHRPNGK